MVRAQSIWTTNNDMIDSQPFRYVREEASQSMDEKRAIVSVQRKQNMPVEDGGSAPQPSGVDEPRPCPNIEEKEVRFYSRVVVSQKNKRAND